MTGNWVDWTLFSAYLIVIFAFGLYMSRRESSASVFFLAGRRLPWYAIAISLFASNISSGSLVGLAGDAYRYGMAVSALEWGAILGLLLLTFVYLPHYRTLGVFTTPEFLEKRYNPGTRCVFALTVIAVEILVYMPFVFYAGAMFMNTLFGFSAQWSIVGIAAFVGIYTTLGGLGAVVWTDVLQGILMVIGGTVVVVLAIGEIGGLTALEQQVPTGHFSIDLPADHVAYPFPWALLGGYFLVTIYYWCHNQTIVQRTFAARTDWDASMGAIGACYIKLIMPFIIVLPGILAAILLPDLENSDQAFPLLIQRVVPSGLMGLIMATMVASLMSSADSGLNSLATIFTNDFYRRWIDPQASDRTLVLVGRLSSVAILLAIVARALTMQVDSLMQFFQVGLAYLAAPVILVFGAGLFWRRATPTAAFATFLVSPFVCYTCQIGHTWWPWWPTSMIFWMLAAVGILFLFLVVVSLATTAKSSADLRGLIWDPKRAFASQQPIAKAAAGQPTDQVHAPNPSARIWTDHRLWAGLALVLMLLEMWWLF